VGTSTAEGGGKPDQTLAALLALWPSLKPTDQQGLLRPSTASQPRVSISNWSPLRGRDRDPAHSSVKEQSPPEFRKRIDRYLPEIRERRQPPSGICRAGIVRILSEVSIEITMAVTESPVTTIFVFGPRI
jgi:hypothetical protein